MGRSDMTEEWGINDDKKTGELTLIQSLPSCIVCHSPITNQHFFNTGNRFLALPLLKGLWRQSKSI